MPKHRRNFLSWLHCVAPKIKVGGASATGKTLCAIATRMDSIKKNIIVDVSEILKHHNRIEYSSKGDSQKLLIPNTDNSLIIEVTIADSVFEWFIDVCDNEKNVLLSTWVDHYGNTKENLRKEMTEEISGFINTVTTKNTRLESFLGKLTKKELKKFQYEENGEWKDFEIFG